MPATRKIMLIRHGEKPDVHSALQGIDESGNIDPESMTAEGWKRARLLVSLFDPPSGRFRTGLARPTMLFASKINGDHGKRPAETLEPLASALHLAIDQSYSSTKTEVKVIPTPAGSGFVLAIGSTAGQIPDLVKAITAKGGFALVAWRRGDIPRIAQLIAPGAAIPVHWPAGRYDLVWVFDLNDDGTTYRFTQVPQSLLPGDVAKPI
jgi:hypothetical protein